MNLYIFLLIYLILLSIDLRTALYETCSTEDGEVEIECPVCNDAMRILK